MPCGDALLVSKLDRLARSLPEARDIADELTRKGVALNLDGSVYVPHDRWASFCSTFWERWPSSMPI